MAVAGYGQRLRGDPWVGDRFGWGQIGALADGAKGSDPYGLRSQFVQLVHEAKDAKSENEQASKHFSQGAGRKRNPSPNSNRKKYDVLKRSHNLCNLATRN